MGRTIFKDFNLGGMADSLYQGLANSLYRIVGLDIHSKPGILQLSQALKKDSGSTVNDLCKHVVVCSNGESYWFGSINNAGKVWRRSAAGAWSEAYDLTPTSGNSDCLGAREYNGYIYWATQSYLHRITIANALTATWSVLDANWQLFTNTDADFHPMEIVNEVLYIGDKNLVSKVDGTAFTANAFTKIKTPHRISALGKKQDTNELLIGTYIAASVVRCSVYRWNTYSGSYTSDDDIYEVGVNAFLPFDNLNVIQAGTKGNFYYYDGSAWQPYRRVQGDWSVGNTSIVYPMSSVNENGIVLFGFSKTGGSASNIFGIGSLGGYAPNYPKVLHFKHIISSTNYSDVKIGAMALIGDKLLAAWTDSGGGVGVDIVDTANKTPIGFIETRVVSEVRDELKKVALSLCYRRKPTGTGFTFFYDKDGAGYVSLSDSKTDAGRNLMQVFAQINDAPFINFKIELTSTAASNNTPEVDQIIVDTR